MTKIAAIQMCSSNVVEENLKTAGDLISKAAYEEAKLIVLPEMFAFIETDPKRKLSITEKYGAGKIQDLMAELALKHKVWIVAGTIPLAGADNNKARAACLVYNDRGEVCGRYDKIHLFDVTLSEYEAYRESDTIEPGTQCVVIKTPFGKLGLVVCFDIRFPNLFHHLFNQGAEIIAVPSAFTVKTGDAHWHLLMKSRAVENFSYLIGACQGGTHNTGRKTYGHSLIVEPWGSIVAECMEDGAGIIYAHIDLDHLYRIRKSIPMKEYRKRNL